MMAAIQVIADVLAAYQLEGDDAIDAIRAFRSILHGFVSLETAGGFALKRRHQPQLRPPDPGLHRRTRRLDPLRAAARPGASSTRGCGSGGTRSGAAARAGRPTAACGEALPGVVDAQRHLRGAQEEVAVGPQDLTHPAQDVALGLDVEVDQHVAEEDDVEAPAARQGRDQVERSERDVALMVGPTRQLAPARSKCLTSIGRRQTTVDLQLAVLRRPAPARALRRRGRSPSTLARLPVSGRGVERDRDAVRLLAAGAGGAPDPQRCAPRASSASVREDGAGSAVNGSTSRKNDVSFVVSASTTRTRSTGSRPPLQLADVGVDVRAPSGAGQRQQPRLDQVLLAGVEDDRALGAHEVGDVGEGPGLMLIVDSTEVSPDGPRRVARVRGRTVEERGAMARQRQHAARPARPGRPRPACPRRPRSPRPAR